MKHYMSISVLFVFQKKMSSTIVRRLGIPECILLVTQRITKYPVLLQRILHHTKGEACYSLFLGWHSYTYFVRKSGDVSPSVCAEVTCSSSFPDAENEEDHDDITQALRLVKEILNVVDNKMNEHDKKKRLKEVYSRTDSKSIQRMKSGQMFAREDLVRGRRLLHDGPLQLKNSAGRLKGTGSALFISVSFAFSVPR